MTANLQWFDEKCRDSEENGWTSSPDAQFSVFYFPSSVSQGTEFHTRCTYYFFFVSQEELMAKPEGYRSIPFPTGRPFSPPWRYRCSTARAQLLLLLNTTFLHHPHSKKIRSSKQTHENTTRRFVIDPLTNLFPCRSQRLIEREATASLRESKV